MCTVTMGQLNGPAHWPVAAGPVAPAAPLYVMSSIPRFQPDVKLTVTTVDAWAQPVVTACMDPVATARVSVCPRSSESVSVPAPVVNTFMLVSTRGPGENWKLRDVPGP